MWQGNNAISPVQDRSSHVKLGLLLKMVARKKLAIQIACALICSKNKKKKPFSEMKPFLLILWSITPPRTPTALYLALSLAVGHCQCSFQSEHFSHSRILNRRQVQIFSTPNTVSHRTRRLVDDSLRSHLCSYTLRDCHSREWAPICRAFVGDFSKPVGKPKSGLKSCSLNSALLPPLTKNLQYSSQRFYKSWVLKEYQVCGIFFIFWMHQSCNYICKSSQAVSMSKPSVQDNDRLVHKLIHTNSSRP